MTIDHALLGPGALPPVPTKVSADRFDNFVREYGVGYCCQWFGHDYDGDIAEFIFETLKQRNDEAMGESA